MFGMNDGQTLLFLLVLTISVVALLGHIVTQIADTRRSLHEARKAMWEMQQRLDGGQ